VRGSGDVAYGKRRKSRLGFCRPCAEACRRENLKSE
jgi:hypothetical protein